MHIPLKYRIEYLIVRALSALVCVLPYRAALAVGATLAWIAFYIFRFRVAAARARIRHVIGPEPTDREINRIAWISLRNLAFNVIELMRMPIMTKRWIEQHVEQQLEQDLAGWDRSRGAILAVPHTGNWDLAGVGSQMLGLPMFFMARRQKNQLVDDWLGRMRGVTGIETIHTDSGALRKVIRNLKNGKVFAILPDVRARNDGIRVRFFNGEPLLATGMEAFSRHADVPIFPAVVTRTGWTRHRWNIHPPILPDPAVDRDTDQRRMMQEVMDLFDQAIKAAPEQYFWYNKRWILDPHTAP